MTFDDFDLHPRLQENLQALDFHLPTPIQARAIPPALAGRDVLGSAETGTGKTAAFFLPILTRLLDGGRSRSPRVLVLAPTRELALQVTEHGERLARGLPLRFATLHGGVAVGPQTRRLRRGVDVVVATPGRLLDLLGRGHVRFEHLEVLVIDEADRMLDIGFLPDIRRSVRQLPRERQTMLLSATLSPIEVLAEELTRDAVRVEVEQAATPEAIEQVFYPVLEHRKMNVLRHLLSGKELTSVLVFTRTKRRADLVSSELRRDGVDAAVIHGDRDQTQRTRVLDSFRRGRTRVLVATDVASRGIDVTGISHVVNYDVPTKAEDYVHRIGRTGRAEASGTAWTLVAPLDETHASRIQHLVDREIERLPLEGVDTGRMTKRKPEKVRAGSSWRVPSRRRRRLRRR